MRRRLHKSLASVTAPLRRYLRNLAAQHSLDLFMCVRFRPILSIPYIPGLLQRPFNAQEHFQRGTPH